MGDEEVIVKILNMLVAVSMMACAAESTDTEWSVDDTVSPVGGATEYGGVPLCGTYNTPPCPAPSAPVSNGGVANCGTPTSPIA